MLLLSVVQEKLGNHAGADVVASAQRLIVNVVRRHRHRKVVLVQRRRRGVEKPVDAPNRLVRARTLLQVDAGRVGQRRQRQRRVHGRSATVRFCHGRRSKLHHANGAASLAGGAQVHGRMDRRGRRVARHCSRHHLLLRLRLLLLLLLGLRSDGRLLVNSRHGPDTKLKRGKGGIGATGVWWSVCHVWRSIGLRLRLRLARDDTQLRNLGSGVHDTGRANAIGHHSRCHLGRHLSLGGVVGSIILGASLARRSQADGLGCEGRYGIGLVGVPVLRVARGGRKVLGRRGGEWRQVGCHGQHVCLGRRDWRLEHAGVGGEVQRRGGLAKSAIVVLVEARQLRQPRFPFLFGGEQIVSHVAEELDLHDVDFLHAKARDFSPCLVGVGVVVENYCG